MSDIIEAAKSHFREKLGGGLQSIEVPEWVVKGKPVKIWYKPSLNFSQQEKILALSDAQKKGEAIVEALIQKGQHQKRFIHLDTVDRRALWSY